MFDVLNHLFQIRAADVVTEPVRLAIITATTDDAGIPFSIETWEIDADSTAYRCIVIHLGGRALVCAEPTRPKLEGRMGEVSLRTWFSFTTEHSVPVSQDYIAEKMGFVPSEYGHVDAYNLTKLIAAALRRSALLMDASGLVSWVPPMGVDRSPG